MTTFLDLMKDGTIYQFVLMIALVIFDGIFLVMTGTLEPMISGAIIGLAVGIPSTKTSITNNK